MIHAESLWSRTQDLLHGPGGRLHLLAQECNSFIVGCSAIVAAVKHEDVLAAEESRTL